MSHPKPPAPDGPWEATTLAPTWGGASWASSSTRSGSFALAVESVRADFELPLVPLALERHRCRFRPERPFSSSCLQAYVRGTGRCCSSCSVALPVALQAFFALGIDRALATVVRRGLERSLSKSRFYG